MRLCPECDTRTEGEVCPKCGTRTYFAADSDAGIDPLLGQVLDKRYRIEERIGRGGMGTVYRAVQIAMNRTVAVKVMNPELARNNEAVKRFHREARAATAFEHPHAIRLIDFGQAKTHELFMVMELLRGRSLSQVIKDETPFSVARAAKVCAEIAKALAAAHGVGLMHRDMKPDNVFLLDVAGDHDFVKVLDFGIAKFVAGSGDSTMTRTGLIVGTPQFMAPEQAQPGRKLTPAIDVYALGVMLFTMLAGRHPFGGNTPLDALLAHVNQPVPELPHSIAATDEVRLLLRRMLAKDPEVRPSAEEVFEELEAVRFEYMAARFAERRSTKGKPKRDELPTVEAKPPREVSVGPAPQGATPPSPSSLVLRPSAALARPSSPQPRPSPSLGSPSPSTKVKVEETEPILWDPGATDEMLAFGAGAPDSPPKLSDTTNADAIPVDGSAGKEAVEAEPTDTRGESGYVAESVEPEVSASAGVIARDPGLMDPSDIALALPRRRAGAWMWWAIAGVSLVLALGFFLVRGGEHGVSSTVGGGKEESADASEDVPGAERNVALVKTPDVAEATIREEVVEPDAAPEAGATVERPNQDVVSEGVPKSVPGDEATSTLPPPPSTVGVRFASTPSGASVYRDSTRLGETPFTHRFARDAGQQTFVFRRQGYREQSVTALVVDGAAVTAALEKSPPPKRSDPVREKKPKPPAPPPTVTLRFVSAPSGAKVYAGRAYLGDTEFSRVFRADTGKMTFTCKKTGYKDAIVIVDVGNARVVTCRMVPLIEEF